MIRNRWPAHAMVAATAAVSGLIAGAAALLCGLDLMEFALIGAITGGGVEFIRQRSPHQ